jgi:hypothetical protein
MEALRSQLVRGMPKERALGIARRALSDHNLMLQLDGLSTYPDQTLSGKAAWILAIAVELLPACGRPFALKWTERMAGRVPENIMREYLRALLAMPPDPDHAGPLIDLCFRLLKQQGHDTGVYYNALRILGVAGKQWPELRSEISSEAQRHIHSESVGIRSLARRLIMGNDQVAFTAGTKRSAGPAVNARQTR